MDYVWKVKKIKKHLQEFFDKYLDTFDGAKPRFLNRGKKRRSVSTLSIPRAEARGVEWVDLGGRMRKSMTPRQAAGHAAKGFVKAVLAKK